MLADSFHNVMFNPIRLDRLKATKAVRNFLCDNLYRDDLLVSYAPASEFGSAQAYGFIAGGHFCAHDKSSNTIIPQQKTNFRIIRHLFDVGLIQVKKDIHTPHPRCVIFEWIDDIAKYRREILRHHIFNEHYTVTHALVNNTAALYGLKVNFIGARGVFEILDGEGNAIPNKVRKKTVANTYLFMNDAGEPVSRLRDMNYWEWEDYLYNMGVKTKLINSPLLVDGGYFTQFKKN